MKKKKEKPIENEELSSRIEFSMIEDVDVEQFFTRKFKSRLKGKYKRLVYGILTIIPSEESPHVHMLFSPPREMVPGKAKGLVVFSFKPIRKKDLKEFVREIKKMKPKK